MRGNWIIDERGDVWPEDDQALLRTLCTERNGSALTHFMLTQLGFVAVREYEANRNPL